MIFSISSGDRVRIFSLGCSKQVATKPTSPITIKNAKLNGLKRVSVTG